MDENLRQRAKKKLLRVTLPDGSVICHKSTTMTFVEALANLDTSLYDSISLENSNEPLLSKTAYSGNEEYVKSLCNGWFVNVNSDSDKKFRQLLVIIRQFNLNMQVEIGTDFIASDVKVVQKKKKRDSKLLVKFSNGEYAAGENPIDTLLDTIWQIGPENIKRKELSFMNKPIITTMKKYNGQVQVGQDLWLTVPSQTKEKYKLLRIIDAMMKLKLEVSII